MNKIKAILSGLTAVVGMVLGVSASAASSTEEIATAFGGILDSIVAAVKDVAVAFLTSNWPLIATISVTIGLVFFLYYKLRGAIRGK